MISSSMSEFIFATISAGWPASARRRSRSISLRNRAAQVGRRHHQLLQARRIRIAGQGAEERRRVLGDRLRRRHQAEVGVDARRPLVVVAGAEVHVAAQAVRRPPDDQADLRVRLVAADAVDHVRARLLERARPAGCCAPRRSARSARPARSPACCARPRAAGRDDRRPDAGAIQRLLDRQHVGIVGRLRRAARPPGRRTRRGGAAARRARPAPRRGRACSLSASTCWPAAAAGRAARRSPAARSGRAARADRAARERRRRRPARCRAGRGAAPSSSSDARRSTSSRTTSLRRRRRTSRSTTSRCVRPPSSSSSSSASRASRMTADSRIAWPGNSCARCARMMSSSSTKQTPSPLGDVDEPRQARRAPGRSRAAAPARRRSGVEQQREVQAERGRAAETAARRRSPAASAPAAPPSRKKVAERRAARLARGRPPARSRCRAASSAGSSSSFTSRYSARDERVGPVPRSPPAAATGSGRPGRASSSPSSTARWSRGHAHHEELVEVRRRDGGELDPLEQRRRRDPRPPRARAR